MPQTEYLTSQTGVLSVACEFQNEITDSQHVDGPNFESANRSHHLSSIGAYR